MAIIEYLLSMGASTEIKDVLDDTSLDIIFKYKNRILNNLVKKYKAL